MSTYTNKQESENDTMKLTYRQTDQQVDRSEKIPNRNKDE